MGNETSLECTVRVALEDTIALGGGSKYLTVMHTAVFSWCFGGAKFDSAVKPVPKICYKNKVSFVCK